MTTKTQSRKAVKSAVTSHAAQSEKLVALTLKIDRATYLRLSTLRAKERKTAQDILSEALDAYLDRTKA